MSKLLGYLPQMFKAITAALTAGSAAYAGAVDGGVTGDEWIVVVAAGLAAAVAVYLVPNKVSEV